VEYKRLIQQTLSIDNLTNAGGVGAKSGVKAKPRGRPLPLRVRTQEKARVETQIRQEAGLPIP